MSPWFRWHEGTTEDGKFRVVSRNAGVTVRDVIALWAFMLEDAASAKHRGVCTRNGDFMAAILDFDGDEVSRILKAMELVEMIGPHVDGISVCNWGKRQYETDTKDATNAIRQKRYRQNNPNARKTDSKRDRNGSVTARNGDVTARKHTEAETDTEAETEKKEDTASAVPSPEYFFESGIIRLSEKDFGRWKEAYSFLDLRAELLSLTDFAQKNPDKWFFAVQGALAKRNRGAKLAQERAGDGEFKLMSGMQGVI